jgi:hypothetical protein
MLHGDSVCNLLGGYWGGSGDAGMNPIEINRIVHEVEVVYRNKMGYHNTRLRAITPEEVRSIMKNNMIGLQCEKCLNKNGGRYCSKIHSEYYRSITDQTYGVQFPYDYEELQRKYLVDDITVKVPCALCGIKKPWPEMSVDHILPISKGGLEFDRENSQWACLDCNLKKHNRIEDKKQTKLNGVLEA